MGLTLARALRLSAPTCAAFVGAGGKTTAMFLIARELNDRDAPLESRRSEMPVIVTATTHLGAWQIPLADQHIIAQSPNDLPDKFEGVTLITGPIEENKTTPIREDLLLWLHDKTKGANFHLLIEADGSRARPLKAPADHEPAIPGFVDIVVVVAGLSGLGKPLSDESVHRPEIFSRLSRLPIGEAITADTLSRVLTHPEGGLKNIPLTSRRAVILNQADTASLQSRAGTLASSLLNDYDAVIVASLQNSFLQAFEQTAGIILAAGESKRFGSPKQLLDWRGQPFIRVVAQTALTAGLSPVIVVTGANADQVEAAVKDLSVTIVRNNAWQTGQASSIRAGLEVVPSQPLHETSLEFSNRRGTVGSAIFLLADQPQIRSDVIRALVAHRATELYSIVAPLVLEEQRANPVLFDRDTFSDLMKLEGDIGGRAIFSKHHVEFMPWHDDRLLLDVDRPEDYQRLIEDDTL